jgi:DNA-binding beta-propeller fold protein YncE
MKNNFLSGFVDTSPRTSSATSGQLYFSVGGRGFVVDGKDPHVDKLVQGAIVTMHFKRLDGVGQRIAIIKLDIDREAPNPNAIRASASRVGEHVVIPPPSDKARVAPEHAAKADRYVALRRTAQPAVAAPAPKNPKGVVRRNRVNAKQFGL